jgi:hypothetical protein
MNDPNIKLKQELAQIEESINLLNLKLDNGINNITDYFDFLRNQVQLKTESIIMDIQKCSDDILNKIDSNELECKQKYQNENINKLKYSNLIEEYQNIQKDDIEILNLYKNKLKREITNLENEIFSQRRANFNENQNEIKETIIGTLTHTSTNNFDFADFKNKFKLRNHLNDYFHDKSRFDTTDTVNKYDPDFDYDNDTSDYDFNKNRRMFLLNENDNESVIICYESTTGFITFALFSQKMDLIKTVPTNIKNSSLYAINSFGNNIIFNSKQSDHCFLTIMSENLIIIRQVNIDDIKKNYYSICADSNEITCCHLSASFDIYDWNLNKLKTIGQYKDNLPFYLKDDNCNCDTSGSPIQVDICDRKYILRFSNKIHIIDADSGKETAVISLTCNQFLLKNNFNKEIIILCKYTNEIYIYNTNGKLLENIHSIGFTQRQHSILSHFKNNQYFLFDPKQFILYEYQFNF